MTTALKKMPSLTVQRAFYLARDFPGQIKNWLLCVLSGSAVRILI
jgi:hypothetical protein